MNTLTELVAKWRKDAADIAAADDGRNGLVDIAITRKADADELEAALRAVEGEAVAWRCESGEMMLLDKLRKEKDK